MRGKYLEKYDVKGINVSVYLPEPYTTYHTKGNTKKRNRAQKSIDSMMAEGRRVKIVVPDHLLSPIELETLRAFYCKLAKEEGVNYIYFDSPATTSPKEDLNMFD